MSPAWSSLRQVPLLVGEGVENQPVESGEVIGRQLLFGLAFLKFALRSPRVCSDTEREDEYRSRCPSEPGAYH